MARLDRARLDAATFPFTVELPIRFADTDLQSHVNNVAAAGLLQEARVLFNRRVGVARHAQDGVRMMVGAVTIEYAGEMLFPGDVEIGTGVARLGRTSYTLAQRARQDGRATLYAETTLVIADGTGSIPIPDALRAELEGLAISDNGQSIMR